VVASGVYLLVDNHVIDLSEYIRSVLFFSASAPFYFVLIYLQLTIVSPLLFKLVTFCNSWRFPLAAHAIAVLGLSAVAWATMRFTFMIDVHGGGKFLLGGTYLVCYYLGMVFGSRQPSFKSAKAAAVMAILTTAATVVWCRWTVLPGFWVDQYVPFGAGLNPPSLSLGVYAILVGLVVFSAVEAVKSVKVTRPLIGLLAGGGGGFFVQQYQPLADPGPAGQPALAPGKYLGEADRHGLSHGAHPGGREMGRGPGPFLGSGGSGRRCSQVC
jgi:hypothetical protein